MDRVDSLSLQLSQRPARKNNSLEVDPMTFWLVTRKVLENERKVFSFNNTTTEPTDRQTASIDPRPPAKSR